MSDRLDGLTIQEAQERDEVERHCSLIRKGDLEGARFFLSNWVHRAKELEAELEKYKETESMRIRELEAENDNLKHMIGAFADRYPEVGKDLATLDMALSLSIKEKNKNE